MLTLPVETITCPSVYDEPVPGSSVIDDDKAPNPCAVVVSIDCDSLPQERDTNRSPPKFLSSPGNALDELFILTYSDENPVCVVFLIRAISPSLKPLTLSTDIDVVDFPTPTSEPLIVVEFATHNCPPTAFTVSFSNTVVLKVPLIFASSTSKNPFLNVDNLNPLKSEI